MKLTYPPLLTVYNISFLQHLLFRLILVYVYVKVPYFHQDLKRKSTKQKSCGKSFKIVLALAYGQMPRKLQLMIFGRIAYFINGFKNSKRCFTVVIL